MDKQRGHRIRVYVVVFSLLGVYGALFARLCVIQATEASKFRALAHAQHVTEVRLAERRGSIFDRAGRQLAVSMRVPSLFANPRVIADHAAAARRLGELLDVDAETLYERLGRRQEVVCLRSGLTDAETMLLKERPAIRRLGRAAVVEDGSLKVRPALIADAAEAVAADLGQLIGRPEEEVRAKLTGLRSFVYVKRKVTDAERKAVLSDPALTGIGVTFEYQRAYPHRIAAELVGFVGIDENGLEGVELGFNDLLAGEPGRALFRRDAAGRYIDDPSLPAEPAVPGHDIELTIDAIVQKYVEDALDEVWTLWAPKSATAVVLDPATGDLLAAASLPSFDPNDYGDLDPEELKERCRARYIADWMEPGSIMKPFVLSGVLTEGIVKEEDVIFCENGAWMLGSRLFHDHHAYGDLTVAEVIVKSSNIGAAKLGRKLGKHRLYRYLRAFGFGEPTGFPLPGENPGCLRPPSAWRLNYSLPSISIGQEVCVNVLQMTLAYGAIANDGVRMRPRLVHRIFDADGVARERLPREVGRVIPASIARRVRRVLFQTVEEGTGRRAKLELYSIGGKTGTAQKAVGRRFSHSKVFCSFVGIAPVEHPRIVVMVSVDEPTKHTGGRHFGGTVAAPAVGSIINRTLAYLGVPPDKAQLLARLDDGETRSEVRR